MTWKTIYCPACDRRISNNALGKAAHFRNLMADLKRWILAPALERAL